MINDLKFDINKVLTKDGALNPYAIRKYKKVNKNIFISINESTSFLSPDIKHPTREKIYCVVYNITKQPTCPGCGKILKFRGFKRGYPSCCAHCIRVVHKNYASCSSTRKKSHAKLRIKLKNQFESNLYIQSDILSIQQFIQHRIKSTRIEKNYALVNDKYLREYSDMLCSILKNTSHILPIDFKHLDWSQRFYIIHNNITELPLCETCHKKTPPYLDFVNGYGKICSIKCHDKTQSGHTRILSHFKQIAPYIKKQGFEILDNPNYEGLNKTNIDLKCTKCGNIITKDLCNAGWKDIYCYGCYGNSGVSHAEKEVVEWLKTIYHQKIEENFKPFKDVDNFKELDIFLPDKNIAIEYNGLYWHSDATGTDKNYHLDKTKLCETKEIRLIHIFEDEWLFKQSIVKSRIKHILGLVKYSIGARECEIKEIDTKIKTKFLNKYHIQGEDKSEVKLGAFYKNRLIGVMTFGKLRKALGQKHEIGSYELIRFCTIGSFNFSGLASRFLHYFETKYAPKQILSYADRRWSNGNLYKQLGFVFGKYSDPSYWYFNGMKRYHRFNFRKNVLKDKLDIFDPNLTEVENMTNNKWHRIWDCGNYVFHKYY
jgi:hypothetical protein